MHPDEHIPIKCIYCETAAEQIAHLRAAKEDVISCAKLHNVRPHTENNNVRHDATRRDAHKAGGGGMHCSTELQTVWQLCVVICRQHALTVGCPPISRGRAPTKA